MKAYLIPEAGVNAFYRNGNAHLVIAAGRYSTIDEEIATFLDSYPNVQFLSETPDAPACTPGAFSYLEPQTPPAVLNGGFSGGSCGFYRPLKGGKQ